MSDILYSDAAGPHSAVANANKRLRDMGDGSFAEVISAISNNVTTKFREAFEILDTRRWSIAAGTGDIVQVDGNTASASYLVVSKSPWNAGNETTLETIETYQMPVEISFGAHRSQATLGQEFSVELVDTTTPMPITADLPISSITQTLTVLTIDFVTPHGLTAGRCIGVRDCSNQLVNYPALVVASTPSPTQITVTAGPGGTIPSQTITNPVGDKGFVFLRERLGRANNGASQIFENATVTNASYYVRSETGDALPSGTITGSHSVTTVGSTASAQLVNAPFAYAFAPTTEYRVNVQTDRVQWSDVGVDAITQAGNRQIRTQVCPDPTVNYKLRIRANNSKSLTTLTAKVVSVTKTGTTTGTFITDRPHGLITNDQITYYGNSNTAASAFPNLTGPTAVTVIDATTFSASIGTASTVTGYGGVISKVQGGNLPSALGAINNSVINATLSTLADGTRQLVLTGAAAWSGLLIGDYAEVVGVSNVVNGALLGVDGAWKVANSVTTALTLVPATTAFAATLPVDFVLTNSGGAVVKRTDLRLSFVRVFDFERERVEMIARPTGDMAGAAPVTVQNAPSVFAGGAAGEDAVATVSPVVIGGVVRTATTPTTLIAGDAVRATYGATGAAVTKPFAVTEAGWNYSGSLTTTTAVAAAAAAGANLRRYPTAMQAINTGASAVDLIVLDGVTERWRLPLPVNVPVDINFPTELTVTANTALNVNLSAAGTVRVNMQGYTAP